jgi:hypothetical protein
MNKRIKNLLKRQEGKKEREREKVKSRKVERSKIIIKEKKKK